MMKLFEALSSTSTTAVLPCLGRECSLEQSSSQPLLLRSPLFLGQDGTRWEDLITSVVRTTGDGFVMSGHSNGSYGGVSRGGHDFVAIKVDDDGNVLWKWQVRAFGSWANCDQSP